MMMCMLAFGQIRLIINNLSYNSTMERSDFHLHSRKNSNEESEVSTRQQLNGKEEQPPPLQLSRQMHGHQLQVSPLRTSNQHVNSLMFNEDVTKRCRECLQTQKKTSHLQWQLRSERHKVARLRQIIRVKTQKQQQLQKAYLNIAIELKKKMEASTSGRSKINEADTNSLTHSQNLLSRLGSQVESLQGDVKRLMEEVDYWRAKSEGKQAEVIGSEIVEMMGRESECMGEQKMLNIFYQKEVDRLEHKIEQLEFQLKFKNAEPKTAETHCQKIDNIGFPRDLYGQQLGLNNSVDRREEEEVLPNTQICMIKKEQQISNGSVIRVGEIPLQQNEQSFESLQEVSPLLDEQKLSFSKPKQNKIHQPELSQSINSSQQLARPEEMSFQTAHNMIQDSFQSIHSKRQPSRMMYSVCEPWSDLILQSSAQKPSEVSSQFHSIAEGPNFQSVSNVLSQISSTSSVHDSFKSLRQILNNSILSEHHITEQIVYEIPQQTRTCHQLEREDHKIHQHQLKLQLESQRQNMIRFKDEVHHFLDKIATAFNKFAQKYQLNHQTLESTLKMHYNRRENEYSNLFEKDQMERFLKDLQQQLNKAGRGPRNRYQKLANDRELQLWQVKGKLQDYESDIGNLTQKVQFLLEYNRKLQFQVAELSNSKFNKTPSDNLERNNYMRSVYRRKISLLEPVVMSQMVECDLMPSNYNQLKQEQARGNGYRSALMHLIDSINQIIIVKKPTQQPFKLNFESCLIVQIDRILENAFDILNNYSQRKRKPSVFIQNSPKKSIIKTETDEIDALTILEAENEQLRVLDTQKSDRIIQLKSMNQQQKIQIEKSQKIIDGLTVQIQQLRAKTESMTPQMIKQLSRHSINPWEQRSGKKSQQMGEFMDYSDTKQFNNLHWDHDQEMRQLREQLQTCNAELNKQKLQRKRIKRHVFYVSN